MPCSVGQPPVIVGQPDCYTWLPSGQPPSNQIWQALQYPSLNHKASPPHTTTPQSHLKNRTNKQPQTQATQWHFPIAIHSILPQTYPSTNHHHLPTQHPTVEIITPKPNSNTQSVTNPFLDQQDINITSGIRQGCNGSSSLFLLVTYLIIEKMYTCLSGINTNIGKIVHVYGMLYLTNLM